MTNTGGLFPPDYFISKSSGPSGAGIGSGSSAGSGRKNYIVGGIELLNPSSPPTSIEQAGNNVNSDAQPGSNLPDPSIFKDRNFTNLYYKKDYHYFEYYSNTYHDDSIKLYRKIQTPGHRRLTCEYVGTAPRNPLNIDNLYIRLSSFDTYKLFDPSTKRHLGKELFTKDSNGKFIPAYPGEEKVMSPKDYPPLKIKRYEKGE